MDFTNDSSEWGDMSSWVTEILTQDTTGTLTTPKSASLSDQTTSSVKSPSVSGSDPDTSVARLRYGVSSTNGKIKKRKSRASKRNTTTFIAADPANFRRMVQQVTGFKNGGQVAPLLKPEPQRLFNLGQGSWPTLDSSPFMVGGGQQLSHHVVGPTYAAAGSGYAPVMQADGVGGGFSFQ